MPFVSLTYLLFVLVAVTFFYVIRSSLRLWLLLLISVCFYALADPLHLPLLLVVVVSTHIITVWLNESRTTMLFFALALPIGSLAYFKYSHLIPQFLHASSIGLMPLGISFYTFHILSYVVDVYRGVIPIEKRLKHFLLYVLFWPQLLAGPILRAKEVLPQFEHPKIPSCGDFAEGCTNIVKGLFLKVVLADQLAPYVDNAFATPPEYLGGVDVLAMAFGFGLQIYFDFAGYSYIAIGTAALLGITFPYNFNWPYLATSPKAFWQRWHISLSSWVRDYIYLPLLRLRIMDTSKGGFNFDALRDNNSRLRRFIALFVTWVVMGIWHGGTVNFVLWGIWHAFLIAGYQVVGQSRLTLLIPGSLVRVSGWVLTTFGVMIGWLLFRAPTLELAGALLNRLTDFASYSHLAFEKNYYLLLAIMFSMMIVLNLAAQYEHLVPYALPKQSAEILALAGMAVAAFIFLQPIRAFIYFGF